MSETKLLPCRRKGEHCACFEQGQQCCECGWSRPVTPDPRIAAADEMAKMLEAIIPERDDWWCPACQESLPGSRVTYSECCDTCGTYLGLNSTGWIQQARAALAAYNALR